MLIITATDAGNMPMTGSATVTVIVNELNDENEFTPDYLSTEVAYNENYNYRVMTVKADDDDLAYNAILSYTFVTPSDDEYFSIDAMTGEHDIMKC